jgi:hypothetical protein
MKSACSYLAVGFFLGAITFCLILSLCQINLASFAALLTFNVLFVSIIVHSEGTFPRKVGVLTLGNIVGLLWNFVFRHFGLLGTALFGEVFSALYSIAYPFLNFMWIVSFWSLSLGFLFEPRKI